MMVARKLLLGTTTAMTTVAAHSAATVATKSISSSVRSSLSLSSSSSSSSATMMAMTAGSRTLIEIGNNANNNNDNMIDTQKEFEIDVSYSDDDYENDLLLLRRVDGSNTIGVEDVGEDKFGSCKVGSGSTVAQNHSPRNKSVLYKVSMALKRNPFVTSSTSCILLGNIASMVGIIPIGLSGFVPALSIIVPLYQLW